tara:strand:- start:8995 stop:9276 length:282 start_codon:yes stop_codon:yes gene_type:complete
VSDEILAKLGLTADQVRKALGTPEPPPFVNRDLSDKNYLSGSDQLRMQRRLRFYEGFISAKFLEGYHPGTLGRILACSEESIRVRLRKAGFFS